MGKELRVSETDVVEDLVRFVRECDADSLAMLYGHVFGLNMVVDTRARCNVYVGTPIDGEYCDHRVDELQPAEQAVARG